ncbi:Polyol:NADP oxidoreductase [Budvicia aquatica]|uniref:Polyol:NADP oxidoreductase n=1 Tax=Budvicia aquatica TaxID=82979 RepID=A0A484ZDS2_9GAMM|nr:Polyol:NADP oxidoreductase [Budvicia aquatica]
MILLIRRRRNQRPGLLLRHFVYDVSVSYPHLALCHATICRKTATLPANVILGLAKLQDADLAKWIEDHVSFPSTMVDRIVPAVTAETLAKVTQQLGGIEDPAGVACEPFRQWVIEDNFVNGRPEWEKVGAELVQDVLPFEEMKLRMLNGSHSFLALSGLSGRLPAY